MEGTTFPSMVVIPKTEIRHEPTHRDREGTRRKHGRSQSFVAGKPRFRDVWIKLTTNPPAFSVYGRKYPEQRVRLMEAIVTGPWKTSWLRLVIQKQFRRSRPNRPPAAAVSSSQPSRMRPGTLLALLTQITEQPFYFLLLSFKLLRD